MLGLMKQFRKAMDKEDEYIQSAFPGFNEEKLKTVILILFWFGFFV